MKLILVMLAIVLTFFVSAIAHEADMARNFKKYGDAKAWFFPIVGKSNKLHPPRPSGASGR